MSRKTARRHSFILLFQTEFYEDYNLFEHIERYFLELNNISCEDKDFITREVSCVYENLSFIDTVISKHLTGWGIDRLNKIDLAIIRLAIYEMLYEQDIPMNVSINEAVELAKTYGTDESYQFVNGILSKVFTLIKEQNVK